MLNLFFLSVDDLCKECKRVIKNNKKVKIKELCPTCFKKYNHNKYVYHLNKKSKGNPKKYFRLLYIDTRDTHKEQYEKSKNHRKEYRKKYNIDNKERIKEQRKEYYLKRGKKMHKLWRDINKGIERTTVKNPIKTNEELVKSYFGE